MKTLLLFLAMLMAPAALAAPTDPICPMDDQTEASADTPLGHDCPCLHETDCEAQSAAEETAPMKPVDQTRSHDAAAGVPGNCMQAAIASLLELDIDQVPDFTDGVITDTPERIGEYWRRVEEFLADRDMYYFGLPEQGLPGLHLASGMSPRGVRHVVVRDGWDVVHDPHPSRAGLVSVDRVHVLVPRDPARFVATHHATAAEVLGGLEAAHRS